MDYINGCVFIITDKAKLVGEEVKGVGVMKDEELKLGEIESSHTHYSKGKGLVAKKLYGPVYIRE